MCISLYTSSTSPPVPAIYIHAQSFSILKSKVLGHVLLLILKQLHMPPHTSTTLSNPQTPQVHYSSLLNFTFTIPLKLLSQDHRVHLTSRFRNSFGSVYLHLLQNLIFPSNAFPGSHTFFSPDYPPSSPIIFLWGSSSSIHTKMLTFPRVPTPDPALMCYTGWFQYGQCWLFSSH